MAMQEWPQGLPFLQCGWPPVLSSGVIAAFFSTGAVSLTDEEGVGEVPAAASVVQVAFLEIQVSPHNLPFLHVFCLGVAVVVSVLLSFA